MEENAIQIKSGITINFDASLKKSYKWNGSYLQSYYT